VVLRGHEREVDAVAISPNNRWVVKKGRQSVVPSRKPRHYAKYRAKNSAI